MNTAEQELAELEQRYWQAIRDKDALAALRMTLDPCTVVGAQGAATLDRRTFVGMLSGGAWKLERFALADVQVRLLGNDIGIVAYKVHEELIVEGKPLVLDAFDSSTWVRREGRWVCALHTESVAGDLFGRDRH